MIYDQYPIEVGHVAVRDGRHKVVGGVIISQLGSMCIVRGMWISRDVRYIDMYEGLRGLLASAGIARAYMHVSPRHYKLLRRVRSSNIASATIDSVRYQRSDGTSIARDMMLLEIRV